MSPNPLVAMTASAPDTRYAPREMPRVGGRNEGRSFEERLTMAASKSKPGSTSKGAAEAKLQNKSETSLEANSKSKPNAEATAPETAQSPETPKAEDQPAELAASQQAVQPTAVSDLASQAVMMGTAQASAESSAPSETEGAPIAATAPETPIAPKTEASPNAGAAPGLTPDAAPHLKGEGTPAKDPVLASALAQLAEAKAKPEAIAKTEAKNEADPEAEEAEAPADAKPAVPVKPVARQTVPSSLDSLHAVKGLTSLKESLDGAPRTETRPASARTESRPMPANLDQVTASVVDEPAPAAAAVKPWEIGEPVRATVDASAIKPESTTLKAEPIPVKDAILRTFAQVQKQPDRPAELRLQLNPEHLGRMEVRVQAHEGVVSAIIRVEHGSVRDLVENQLSALRATLAEQGIKIDRLEVSVNNQGPRDQQQASAGFEFGRQGFGQAPQKDPSGQPNPGSTHHTGWEGWAIDDGAADSAAEAVAVSGFDAQA